MQTHQALEAELSALAELRSLAGLVQAGLLALHDAGVAGEEAFALQHRPQLRVRLDERTGDAVTDSAGLAARPTAVHADSHVVRALDAGDAQRRHHLRTMGQAREVVVEVPAVEPGRPVAGAQDHARDRRLALAGSAIRREVAHDFASSFNGSGACASCGCSGPA